MTTLEIRPNHNGGWRVYLDGTDIADALVRVEIVMERTEIPVVRLTTAPADLAVTFPDADVTTHPTPDEYGHGEQ